MVLWPYLASTHYLINLVSAEVPSYWHKKKCSLKCKGALISQRVHSPRAAWKIWLLETLWSSPTSPVSYDIKGKWTRRGKVSSSGSSQLTAQVPFSLEPAGGHSRCCTKLILKAAMVLSWRCFSTAHRHPCVHCHPHDRDPFYMILSVFQR